MIFLIEMCCAKVLICGCKDSEKTNTIMQKLRISIDFGHFYMIFAPSYCKNAYLCINNN
jgi:hypothetical protein